MNIVQHFETLRQMGIRRYAKKETPEILIGLQENQFSREELVKILCTRYQAAHFFVGMLEHMLQSIDRGTYRDKDRLDPSLIPIFRSVVADNLSEELGLKKGYGGPHSEGRKNLLEALGVDYDAWAAPLGTYDVPGPGVHEGVGYILHQVKGVIACGAVEALTVLWYYENRITLDYPLLLHAFEYRFPTLRRTDGRYAERDPLWHLASHAEHDSGHARTAVYALARLQGLPGMWHESIENGVHETWKGVENFWNLLSEKFGGKFISRGVWETRVSP